MKPGVEFPLASAALGRELAVALAWFGVMALVLAFFSEAVQGMAAVWSRSETFAHGFFVAPVAAWLGWRRRHQLRAVALEPSVVGLLGVGGAVLAWLLGRLAAVEVVQQYAVVLLVIASFIAMAGIPAGGRFAFPLAFLLFAVPAGDILLPWMIERTADFTVRALEISGIPVFREGNDFVVPSGRWSVVEACSGLRYLIATVLGASLFAHLYCRAWWRRIAVVVLGVAIPVIANWLRAYLIVTLAHFSNNQIATGTDHLIYGWFFFGIVIFVFFAVASRFRDDHAVVSDMFSPGRTRQPATASPLRFALAAACVIVLALAARVWEAQIAVPTGIAAIVPMPIEARAGWQQTPEGDWAERFRPHYVMARGEDLQVFEKASTRVAVRRFFYADQRQGEELIGWQNTLVSLNDVHWRPVALPRAPVVWNGTATRARATLLSAGAARILVQQLNLIDGRPIASDYLGKWITALARLRLRGDAGAAVIVYTLLDEDDDEATAAALLRQFFLDMSPAIHASVAASLDRSPHVAR